MFGVLIHVDIHHYWYIQEKIVRVTGYDGLITITDPETSWLDPQL